MKESAKYIDWGKVKITKEIMDGYVMPKYGKTNCIKDNSWSDIILDDIYNTFYRDKETDVAKESEDMTLSIMKESSKATVKDYTKLLVTDEMVEYVLENMGRTEIGKEKEAEHDQLKVNKEVVQLSSDEGFFGDEDVVLFNDVNYPLTDAEIRMFKERPTKSIAPTRQVVSTSTRSRAPVAFTSNAQVASALKGYRKIAMTGCVLGLRAPDDPS
ncbi:hypothetical protein Tco_0734990 [Tanacetum coccineum]